MNILNFLLIHGLILNIGLNTTKIIDNQRIYTDIDNKIFNAFKEALEEKDSNKKYYVMYEGYYPSKHHGRSEIKYSYGKSDRFLMSYKQAYELANCWVGKTYNLKMVEA